MLSLFVPVPVLVSVSAFPPILCLCLALASTLLYNTQTISCLDPNTICRTCSLNSFDTCNTFWSCPVTIFHFFSLEFALYPPHFAWLSCTPLLTSVNFAPILARLIHQLGMLQHRNFAIFFSCSLGFRLCTFLSSLSSPSTRYDWYPLSLVCSAVTVLWLPTS
jgi:hypothetical protein